MGLWKPARNAPLPSADDLRASFATGERKLAADEAEAAEIVEALPGLVGDPERTAQAEARLAELEALLPIERRKLEMIRKAIPAAENRGMLERIRAERTALETRTARLKRNLPERYDRAVEALAAVLRDMVGNADDWQRINGVGASLGEPAGLDAERELRATLPVNAKGWSRLWADLDIPRWDGSLAFEGKPNRN